MTTVQRQNMEMEHIPLRRNDSFWRIVFNRYDRDRNGKISISDLIDIIDSGEYKDEISDGTRRNILRMTVDNSGSLDFDTFLKLIHLKDNHLKSVFGRAVNNYIHTIIPNTKPQIGTDATDGEYDDEYTCCPPRIIMIVLSVVQISLFFVNNYSTERTVANILIFNPYKRFEAWRFLTYMFVHLNVVHLISNVIVQITLGTPLEMVHKWWRVLLVYILGVIAGSLGTSITDPNVFLAGASGGVYALLTAHIATIIMNWSEMDYAIYQLLCFLIITASDFGTAIYNRYFLELDEKIGFTAHVCGAVAGLLAAILILKNFKVKSWEKKIWWISFVIFIILMGVAIVWNVAWPSYFLAPQRNIR